MPNLDSILCFPSNDAGPSSGGERTPIPPRSSHVLVSDTTDAPALFVLIHFLRASHAVNKLHRSTAASDRKGKGRAHTKVIWLGCNSDGIVHLSNVARKSGVHLDEEMRNGAFCYIDANGVAIGAADHGVEQRTAAMSIHQQEEGKSRVEQALQELYGRVSRELAEADTKDRVGEAKTHDWASKSVIMIDDLTALAWVLDPIDSFGQPVDVSKQLINWVIALASLAARKNASLVTLMHADATSCSKAGASDPTDESLLAFFLQKADVWIEVKELASGRARDCDGEITVHPLVRPSLARTLPSSNPSFAPQQQDQARGVPPLQAFAVETPCPSRAKAVLYRIAPDGQSAALGRGNVGSNTGRVQIWARGTGRGFL